MKKVGQYELIKLIGQGAYGNVYEARKHQSNQKFAIKMIPNEHINAKQMEIIEKQIEILKKIQHPNIVKLLDHRKTKNNYYLIFQFCENGDLQNYLKKNYKSQIPQQIIQKFMYEISNALFVLHSKGIVHRDIKLANILLTKSLQAKLADFGFAKSNESSKILMQTYCGTPITMAPEVLERKKYDSKCDIWSLGVIAYQLVYRKPPFMPSPGGGIIDLMEMIQKSEKVDFPQKPQMKQSFKNLIRICLKKEAEQRATIEQIFNNQWIQQGKLKPLNVNKQDPTSRDQLKIDEKQEICQTQSNIVGSKQNIQQMQKSMARRIYNCLKQQLLKIVKQIRLSQKNIDLLIDGNNQLSKLKKFMAYSYLKSLKNSKIKVIYRKQQFEFKINQVQSLNQLIDEDVQEQFVSFKKVIFNYLERIINQEKINPKQKTIQNYKVILEFLPLIKRYWFKIQLTTIIHQYATKLSQIKKNILNTRFSQQNTNFLTICLEYIPKTQEYFNELKPLKNLCQKRIRDIEQEIHGY